MRMITLLAMSAMSIAVVSPALAADAMMKPDKMTKMSAADTKKMKACQAMPSDKMAMNAGCKKMMKMHPDMMKSDGMMKHDDAMKPAH